MTESAERKDQAEVRWQSTLLVWVCAPFLAMAAVKLALFFLTMDGSPQNYSFLIAIPAASILFALVVYLARAATTPAACVGGLLVFCLMTKTCIADVGGVPTNAAGILHSGLPSLMALFVLTFLGTRWRRGRKQALGVAEPKTGRKSSQVLANLSVACLFPVFVHGGGVYLFAAVLAAHGEATADTWMLTTFKQVAAGVDGGVSWIGTLAGLIGAVLVVGIGAFAMRLTWFAAAMAFSGAVFGLLLDSLLGAAIERRGWVNNDVVNFSSTLAAAVVGGLLMLI
jgi:uncharacterized protein (TIGR00297 family)